MKRHRVEVTSLPRGGGNISIDGDVVVRDKRCTRVDELSLIEDAQKAQDELFAAAGITRKPTWPVIAAD